MDFEYTIEGNSKHARIEAPVNVESMRPFFDQKSNVFSQQRVFPLTYPASTLVVRFSRGRPQTPRVLGQGGTDASAALADRDPLLLRLHCRGAFVAA